MQFSVYSISLTNQKSASFPVLKTNGKDKMHKAKHRQTQFHQFSTLFSVLNTLQCRALLGNFLRTAKEHKSKKYVKKTGAGHFNFITLNNNNNNLVKRCASVYSGNRKKKW